MAYPIASKFARYDLNEQERRDVEKLLSNGILQAHLHNLQADYADMMTALLAWEVRDAEEYRLRMASLQGGIRALEQLIRDSEFLTE